MKAEEGGKAPEGAPLPAGAGAAVPAERAALREVLLWAYRLILDREPENEAVFNPSDDDTREKIRSRFFGSIEYHNRIRAAATLERIRMLREREEAAPPALLFQTADPLAYRDLALTAARYNAAWAARYGWEYRLHLGLQMGHFPHHAAHNRIVLFDELVRAGFRGWALYVDADNLLLPGRDLRAELALLPGEGRAMVFFDERPAAEGDFSFLNAGMMALFLGDPDVQALIAAWRRFYEETYPETFWPNATRWGDVLNTQDSLRTLLELFSAAPGFREKIVRKHLQNYAHWFGRGQENPDAADIESRTARLRQAGLDLYGF